MSRSGFLALRRPVLLDQPDLVNVNRHQRSQTDGHPAACLVYARDLAGKLDLLPPKASTPIA
jgi:hypothetical protein